MRRRAFITALGGAAAWPLVGYTQQQGKLPTIGFLGSGAQSSQRPWADAFVHRLRELGWIEGRTIAIEYRWAEGRADSFDEIAAEFVRLKVDLIYAVGTEASLAAKKATSVIPIVFPVAGDPVGTGMAASLVRPGANVTGLSNQAADLAAKRLEILREVVPGLSRVAIMPNVGYPGAVLEIGEFQAASRAVGLEAAAIEVRRTEDIAPALESLKGHAEALDVVGDPLANLNRVRINTFTLVARLPTIYVQREYVDAGSYTRKLVMR